MKIGHLERILADGDSLALSCTGTADLGVRVLRADEAIAGFGAMDGRFAATVLVEDDPRVHEEHLYDIKHRLMNPATDVHWLDVRDPAVSNWRPRPRAGRGGLVVAIAAGGATEDRERLINQIARRIMSAGDGGVDLIYIDDRFSTESVWREYLQSLPDTRPADVCVRFTINGDSVELTEGGTRTHSPWQLYVHRVFRFGIPGQLSLVGITQERLGLSSKEIIEIVRATTRIERG